MGHLKAFHQRIYQQILNEKYHIKPTKEEIYTSQPVFSNSFFTTSFQNNSPRLLIFYLIFSKVYSILF